MSTENPFLLYKSLSGENGCDKPESSHRPPLNDLKTFQVNNETIDNLIVHIGLLLVEQNSLADNPSLHISDLKNVCSSAERINDLIRILQKMMAQSDENHCAVQHESDATEVSP